MLTVGYGDVGNFIYYYLFNYKKKKIKDQEIIMKGYLQYVL